MTEHDDKFVDRIKQNLDAQTDNLDAGMQSKLTRARHTALDASQKSGSRSWAPLAATVGAAALSLILGIAVSMNDMKDEAPGVRDLDLLVAEESLEFFENEDLDFYAWVSEQEEETHAG